MLNNVYERVFTTRTGGKYISILLSKSIQNKIDSFFNKDNNDEVIQVMNDIIEFMDDNNIIHDKNYKEEATNLYLSFSVYDLDSDSYTELSDKDLNKIKVFISDKNYDKYLSDISKYYIRLKSNVNIDILNSSLYDKYPEGLIDYLSKLEKELLVTINEVINSMFSEYFYNCKYINFNVWDDDDDKVSANFNVKSKTKDAIKHLNELSDVLENEF